MKLAFWAFFACGILTSLFGQTEEASMRFDAETRRWVFTKDTVPVDSLKSLPYLIRHDIIFGKENGSDERGDKAEGIRLIKLSQEFGSIEAAILLAKLYNEGKFIAVDYLAAEKLLIDAHLKLTEKRLKEEDSGKKAVQTSEAENGDAKAQQMEGLNRYCESYGEERKEAVKWLLRAAKQGQQRAQLALGVIYLNGELVPKNQLEAYKWLLLADTDKDVVLGRNMAKFDDISHTLVAILENKMTKEQIAEGQRAASAFSAVDEVKGKEATELAERLKDTEAKHKDIGFATNPLYLWGAIAVLGLCVVCLYSKRK